MSGRNYVEKRDYPRMAIKASITYRVDGDGKMYTGMSNNLSHTGIQFITERVLSPGKNIEFRLASFDGKVDPKRWPPWEWPDLSGLTALQRSVLYATAAIPYGSVRTYGQVAAAIDRPRACRFVGTTLAKNPYPILIPCHRVIRSDGTTGQFGGGTDLKKRLIERESVFVSSKRSNFK